VSVVFICNFLSRMSLLFVLCLSAWLLRNSYNRNMARLTLQIIIIIISFVRFLTFGICWPLCAFIKITFTHYTLWAIKSNLYFYVVGSFSMTDWLSDLFNELSSSDGFRSDTSGSRRQPRLHQSISWFLQAGTKNRLQRHQGTRMRRSHFLPPSLLWAWSRGTNADDCRHQMSLSV